MEGSTKKLDSVPLLKNIGDFDVVSNTQVFEAYLVFSGTNEDTSRNSLVRLGKDYEAKILEEINSKVLFQETHPYGFEVKYLLALKSVFEVAQLKGIPISKEKIANALVANGCSLEKDYEERLEFVCTAIQLNLLTEKQNSVLKKRIQSVLSGRTYTLNDPTERLQLEIRVKEYAPQLFTDEEFDEISEVNISSFYYYDYNVRNPKEIESFKRIKYLHGKLDKYINVGIIGPKALAAFKETVIKSVRIGFANDHGNYTSQILDFALKNGLLSNVDKDNISTDVYELLRKSVIYNQNQFKARSRSKTDNEDVRNTNFKNVRDFLVTLASTIEKTRLFLSEKEVPENLNIEVSNLLGFMVVEKLKRRRTYKKTN